MAIIQPARISIIQPARAHMLLALEDAEMRYLLPVTDNDKLADVHLRLAAARQESGELNVALDHLHTARLLDTHSQRVAYDYTCALMGFATASTGFVQKSLMAKAESLLRTLSSGSLVRLQDVEQATVWYNLAYAIAFRGDKSNARSCVLRSMAVYPLAKASELHAQLEAS